MNVTPRPFYPFASSKANFTLTWRNLSYTVERKRERNFLTSYLRGRETEQIQILRGVNGVVKSDTLMAVMGPSGAGKTTLLGMISHRIKGKLHGGEILLNGELITKKQMAGISGFVPQYDLSVESLTIQEHLEFMACMKMDRRIKASIRSKRIDELFYELGLNKCAATKLKALSSGERKRISLAVELLTEPKLLFCDEPTTGLDSYSALAVTRMLKQFAGRGRIVVCSVHQPASGLLDLFHEVLLLADGSVAFQGTIAEATLFFDGLGQTCPPSYNNAEFYVSQLSVECGHQGKQSFKRAKWVCDEFERSEFGEKIRQRIRDSLRNTLRTRSSMIFQRETFSIGEFEKARISTQLRWLTWRSYIDCKRNFVANFLSFSLYMLISLLVSTPYFGVMEDIDQRGIQDVQGLLYLVVTETIFTFSYGVFYTFPKELPFLLRDIATDLYYPVPYYLSKIIVLLPGAIFQPLLYSILIYFIAGLKGGFLGFLLFVLPVIMSAVSASAYGCLMSAAFESFSTASLLSVPIDFLSLMFSGIFLHLGNLPAHISWLKYTSQFYYSLEAVSLLQWRQIDHIKCPSAPEEPCIATGFAVLDKYGYDGDHYIIDLCGLLLIFFLSHVIGFLAIYRRSKMEPVY